MPNLSTSNVTDKTYMDFYRKALPAKRDLEELQEKVRSASGVYRSVLKEAGKAGVDTTSITRALADRKLDREEVIAREQAYARMMAASGIVPTFQQDIFGEMPETDLTSTDKEEMADQKAYDDGVFSGESGHSATLNPFHQGTSPQDAWHRGWLIGQSKIVDGMAPKKAPRAARKGRLEAVN